MECQKALPLVYDSLKLEVGYRIDMLIENSVIIELKSVESLNEVHLAQILTYLKLSEKRLGLLVNFNVSLLKKGIKESFCKKLNALNAFLVSFVVKRKSFLSKG